MSAPTLSRESRWLRLGGLRLMFAVLLVSFGDEPVTHSLQRLQSGDGSHLTTTALFVVVAVNLITLGFVLLLAGLDELSLCSNRQAQRGAVARLGAANLLLLCFAVTFMDRGDDAQFQARMALGALSQPSPCAW
jgi:hypothetical protein